MIRGTHRARAAARAALLAVALGLPLAGSAQGVAPENVAVRTLSELQWTDDGAALVGVADTGSRDAAFQAYDGTTGRPTWRLPLDSLRDPTRSRRLTVDRWQPSTIVGELLVESGGDLYLARASRASETPTVRRLTRTKSLEHAARLSPDGSRVAFARDGDLWAIDLLDGRETRLTDDGRPPTVVNGEAPEPSMTIFDRGAPFVWAPESRTLVFLRRDPRGLHLRLVSTITPGALEVETGVPADGSLEEVQWRFDARALAVERRSADGKRLDLLLCHPEKLYCRNLSTRPASGEAKRRDVWFLANGFVWSSTLPQRDGIAFFDTVGRERDALATGEWEAERIEAADEAAGLLLVRASRAVARGGRETALLRVSISSGVAPVVLAAESSGGVFVSPTGAAFVVGAVMPDGSQRHELRALDGKVVASLPPAPAGN